MTNRVIHAFTRPEGSYPPYINISRLDDGSVKVIVRSDADGVNVGDTSTIVLSEADWRSLAWSVFAETADRERGSERSTLPVDVVQLALETARLIPHAAYANEFVRTKIEEAIMTDRSHRTPT